MLRDSGANVHRCPLYLSRKIVSRNTPTVEAPGLWLLSFCVLPFFLSAYSSSLLFSRLSSHPTLPCLGLWASVSAHFRPKDPFRSPSRALRVWMLVQRESSAAVAESCLVQAANDVACLALR